MDFHEITLLASTLRGAPLSCLFVLALHRQPLGNLDLVAATGYGKDTIRAGLHKLQTLGLAEQESRYHGWTLTPQGYQQLNPGQAGLLSEGENLALPLRSSSFKDSLKRDSEDQENQLQLLDSEGEKVALDLITILVRECACPTKRARAATLAALSAGNTATDIELDILRWLAYCRSDQGNGIKNRGVFIAAKIERAEPCPADFKPAMGTELADRIATLEYQIGGDNDDPWIR